MHNDCDEDTPGIEKWGLATYEDFETDTFKSPKYDPKGLILAIDGDQMVALSWVVKSEGGLWATHFTGVRREYRGRRIAQACKILALGYAKACGGKTCRTGNDTRNAAMLAINKKLGFQAQFGWKEMRKRIL